MHFTADHRNSPDNLIRLFVSYADGHVIHEFGDAVVGEEASNKDIGVGKIKLARASFLELRLDLEPAAFLFSSSRAAKTLGESNSG